MPRPSGGSQWRRKRYFKAEKGILLDYGAILGRLGGIFGKIVACVCGMYIMRSVKESLSHGVAFY